MVCFLGVLRILQKTSDSAYFRLTVIALLMYAFTGQEFKKPESMVLSGFLV